MTEEFKIKVKELNLTGLRWSAPGKPKVLFLHGWLDNAASFVPLMETLKGTCDAVAPDMVGHGFSDHKPPGFIYHFVDCIQDAVDVADALEWERFSIVGHSMGAGVASMIAPVMPERIDNLVLLEGLGPLSSPVDTVVERLQTHLRQTKRLPQKKFPRYKSITEAVSARMAAAEISEPACESLVRRGIREEKGAFVWTTDARLRIKTAHPYTEDQVYAFLDAITCPTFLLRANPGIQFDEAIIESRAKRVENLIYKTIAGNHHVHMDEPEQIGEWIKGFWRGLENRAEKAS